MKTIRELYAEVIADESLRAEYMAAEECGREEEFMRAHGCAATADELAQFIENAGGADEYSERASGELSDDELDDVAAGKKCGTVYSDGKPVVSKHNSCNRWRCFKCGCKKGGKHDDVQYLHWPVDYSTHCDGCKYFSYTFHFGTCEHPARRNN